MTSQKKKTKPEQHKVLVTYVDPMEGWRYGFPKMISPIALYDVRGWLEKNGYPLDSLANQDSLLLRFWNDEVDITDLEESYFNHVPDLSRPKSNFKKVGEFMSAMGQEVREVKNARHPISVKTIELRSELIAEEAQELFDELNPYSQLYSSDSNVHVTNLARIAKELVDILYVVYGTGHALGLNLDVCFDEVHNSNLSKLDADGKPVYREDGKVMKGPNYRAPDMNKAVYPDDADTGKSKTYKDVDDNGVRH